MMAETFQDLVTVCGGKKEHRESKSQQCFLKCDEEASEFEIEQCGAQLGLPVFVIDSHPFTYILNINKEKYKGENVN